jgi:chromosome segregation ATPase
VPDDAATTSQADSSQNQTQSNQRQGDQASQSIESLPDWAQKVVGDLRKESADYRTKAKAAADLQKRIDDLEAKDKSELERTQAERDKLKADLDARETRLRDMSARTALTTAVTKAGAKHPDLIVDRLLRDADIDDELNVKNADALVAAAKKDFPDLFRVVDGGADGGRGRQESSNGISDMNRLLRRQAGYAG